MLQGTVVGGEVDATEEDKERKQESDQGGEQTERSEGQ